MKYGIIGSITINFFLLTASAQAAVQYNIINLVTLGYEGELGQSQAWGLNNNGQVVGTSCGRAFRTLPNQPINPFTDNLGWDYATAINDNGVVVGQSFNGQCFAYRTQANQLINYATDNLGDSSEAWGINSSGQVVGDAYTVGNTVYHAFRSTPISASSTAIYDLGSLSSTSNDETVSTAWGINDSGQVVGVSSFSSAYSPHHAFRTAANQPINPATDDLGTLGGTDSFARAINNNGQVVGYADTSCGAQHAYLYVGDGPMKDLGSLGGTNSHAGGINNVGQVVGDSQIVGDIAYHAFLYNGTGSMQDLNDLIDPTSGWVLLQAISINDLGQITGTGIIQGQTHAFLLTPVPEPSTTTQIGIGGVGLLAWVWRRRKIV